MSKWVEIAPQGPWFSFPVYVSRRQRFFWEISEFWRKKWRKLRSHQIQRKKPTSKWWKQTPKYFKADVYNKKCSYLRKSTKNGTIGTSIQFKNHMIFSTSGSQFNYRKIKIIFINFFNLVSIFNIYLFYFIDVSVAYPLTTNINIKNVGYSRSFANCYS